MKKTLVDYLMNINILIINKICALTLSRLLELYRASKNKMAKYKVSKNIRVTSISNKIYNIYL